MFKIPIHGGVDLFGAYRNKVYAGGGSIRNEFIAKTILNYYKNSGQRNNLRLLVAPELGMTVFNDGTDLNVSKLYSVDSVPNDVVQGTAANQPYLAGDIAPTEKYCLNNPNGATRFMTHPTISYSATDKWSLTFVCNFNSTKTTGNYFIGKNSNSESIIGLKNTNKILFVNESGSQIESNVLPYSIFGKTSVFSFSASGDNNLKIYINGNIFQTLSIQTNITLTQIINAINNVLYYFEGKISIYKIQNGEIEVKSEYDMLRSIYPEIESVQIGTQTWATSNFEAVATPMGNIIPEITDNTAWAALTTPAWCHYNNSTANGAIYGKLYNWYAVKLLQTDIDAYNTANPTNRWGWHVPTQAEFTTLQTYLGGASVAGGKLKKEGLTYWNSPNTGATNESVFSAIGGGYRQIGGNFSNNKLYSIFWGITGTNAPYLLTYSYNETTSVGSIENKIQGFSLRLIKD